MKKIVCFLLICCMALSGCSVPSSKESKSSEKDEWSHNFMTGVIKTTERKKQQKMYIWYYDEDLKCVHKEELPYQAITGKESNAITDGNVLYTMARGIGTLNKTGLVLGVNMDTGDIKEYKHEMTNAAMLAVTGDYLFVGSNTDETKESVCDQLARIEKKSGDVVEKDIDSGVALESIFTYKDMLICFAKEYNTSVGGTRTIAYIFDFDFSLKKTVEISEKETFIFHACVIDDNMYFTTQNGESEQTGSALGILNLNDFFVDAIKVSGKSLNDIEAYNNKLYMTEDSTSDGVEGNQLIEYDLNTKKDEVYELNNQLEEIHFANDKLYTLSGNSICCYDINENAIALDDAKINKFKLQTSREISSSIDGNDFYNHGFFFKSEVEK